MSFENEQYVSSRVDKIETLEQELQKTRDQLAKAERVISADVGYNVFEFHRPREEYIKDKQGE